MLARAVIGDFSANLPIPEEEDEFTELYVGIQVMLEAVREKIAEAETLQDELAGVLEDRTDALARSQAEFRSVVDSAPNFIHILDPDLRVSFINRGSELYTVEDLVGRKIGEFLPPTERRRVRRKLREVQRSGSPVQYEYRSVINGSNYWYRVYAGPIHDRLRDTITGIVLITFDITHDRTVEKALIERKQSAEAAQIRTQTLLESIGEGLIVINEHGQIANANPAAAQMLGFTQEELVGKWFPGAVVAVDEAGVEIDPLDRPALRATSNGQVINDSVFYRRKDGSLMPVALTISPVVVQGKPQGAVEVFRDLTHERALDQAKEEFVSLASHQLRTPATGVKAYISMLLDGYAGKLEPLQEEFMRKVFDSNERQLQIINDMLNVARVDAGRIVPEMVSTDLASLVRDIIDEQKATIEERQQRLLVSITEDKIELAIDPLLVRMVIENLLSNASKYTPESGTIELSVDDDPNYVSIRVKDSGVGIAKEDLPKLFKRFSRVNNPLSTKRGGSGLGLYLARNIVLLHRGRLSVDSELGKGTVFHMSLPKRTSISAVNKSKQVQV